MANSKAKLKCNDDKASPWSRQLTQIIHNENLGPNAALLLLVCSEDRMNMKFNLISLFQNTLDFKCMGADVYTNQIGRSRKDKNEEKFLQQAHNNLCCVCAKAFLENVAVFTGIVAIDRKVLKEKGGFISYPCDRSKSHTVYYPFYVFNLGVN
jgi:hypothetical protein